MLVTLIERIDSLPQSDKIGYFILRRSDGHIQLLARILAEI